MANRTMLPATHLQRCSCPSSTTCGCHFTRQEGLCSCDLIKDLVRSSGEVIPDYLAGPDVIPRVLLRGKQEGQSLRRRHKTKVEEREIRDATLLVWKMARNVGSLQRLEKARKWVPPESAALLTS